MNPTGMAYSQAGAYEVKEDEAGGLKALPRGIFLRVISELLAKTEIT